jgi:hypothetical protein
MVRVGRRAGTGACIGLGTRVEARDAAREAAREAARTGVGAREASARTGIWAGATKRRVGVRMTAAFGAGMQLCARVGLCIMAGLRTLSSPETQPLPKGEVVVLDEEGECSVFESSTTSGSHLWACVTLGLTCTCS